MKPDNARCELCHEWINAPEQGAFFLRSDGKIFEVDPPGDAPWAGIFCVCDACMFALEDTQDKKDRGIS